MKKSVSLYELIMLLLDMRNRDDIVKIEVEEFMHGTLEIYVQAKEKEVSDEARQANQSLYRVR